MRGYICDPDKNTECDKHHCWLNGGLCKITTHYEFATDAEREKYDSKTMDE